MFAGGTLVDQIIDLNLEFVDVEDCFALEGGGVYANQTHLRMKFCSISDCVGQLVGGGLYLRHTLGTTELHAIEFDGNWSELGGGVALRHTDSLVRFYSCIFSGNEAARGGAVEIDMDFSSGYARGEFLNCTLFGNQSFDTTAHPVSAIGAGIFINDIDPIDVKIHNSILWGNYNGLLSSGAPNQAVGSLQGYGMNKVVVTYSNIEQPFAPTGGGPVPWAGPGNIAANPKFWSPRSGNFALRVGSPCIDAGDDTQLIYDFLDLDDDDEPNEPIPFCFYHGLVREFDDAGPDTGVEFHLPGICDMGALEAINR